MSLNTQGWGLEVCGCVAGRFVWLTAFFVLVDNLIHDRPIEIPEIDLLLLVETKRKKAVRLKDSKQGGCHSFDPILSPPDLFKGQDTLSQVVVTVDGTTAVVVLCYGRCSRDIESPLLALTVDHLLAILLVGFAIMGGTAGRDKSLDPLVLVNPKETKETTFVQTLFSSFFFWWKHFLLKKNFFRKKKEKKKKDFG